MWEAAEVEPIGCRGKPSLSIRGDENGPSTECLATYLRLRDHWDEFEPTVARDIYELNQNYFSDKPNLAMRSSDEALKSSELLGIGIDGNGKFELTYQFDWQDPRDGHITTILFENWLPAGISIDG